MKRKSQRSPSETADSLTILGCSTGYLASKLHMRRGRQITTNDFRAGMYFLSMQTPVSNIHDLSCVLLRLMNCNDMFIIRGKPLPHVDLKQLHRRAKENYRTPNFGRRYFMVDIDKLSLPDGMHLTPENVNSVVEYAISKLPAELQDVTCFWQLSASSGIHNSSTVSLHVWFWLNRPIPDSVLRRWGASANDKAGMRLIDTALFNDVQAHYTAAPQFRGMEDPFPVRAGLLHKAWDVVALNISEEEAYSSRRSIKPKTARATLVTSKFDGRGSDYFLGQIGDHPGGSGFHQPIIRAIASAVASAGEEGVDRASLKISVQKAILNADRSKHDDDYVTQKASDNHLDTVIDGAIKKFGRRPRLLQGCSPHYIRDELPPHTAKERLQKAISRVFRRLSCK